MAAEFRPLLASQKAAHAGCRLLKPRRHLIESGVPIRLPLIRASHQAVSDMRDSVPAVIQAEMSSASASTASSAFLLNERRKSADLLACADAMKINRGSFFIAWSQFPR